MKMEIITTVGTTKNIVVVIAERKLNRSGHIYQIEETWRVKSIVCGITEGASIRCRPNREWLDGINEWCHKDIHSLSTKAQDMTSGDGHGQSTMHQKKECPWNDGRMASCFNTVSSLCAMFAYVAVNL